MEREPEVAVCYGADPIRGGSYLHAGARSTPPAERAEGVQKAVLRDVLITIRMCNIPSHGVLARTPPCAICSILPTGPVHSTGASRGSKGNEGTYARCVTTYRQSTAAVNVWEGRQSPSTTLAMAQPSDGCGTSYDLSVLRVSGSTSEDDACRCLYCHVAGH